MAFAIIFPFLQMKNLRDIFEDAFLKPSTCSVPRRVLAYGIAENVFTEFESLPLAHMDVTNYGTYSVLCKRQLEVALTQLDIFMPASYENIMALVLGAAWAIEICKPSLCWVLVSTAAGLSQHLGYHRINTMVNDSPEDRDAKIHLFWHIYFFDKTLSLRLGRSSIIQDWDISLPFVQPSSEFNGIPDGKRMLSYWVKTARVHGLIYEKLFCPAAFLKSPEERTRIANELVSAMHQAWFERGEAITTDSTNSGGKPGLVTRAASNGISAPSPHESEVPSRRGGHPGQPKNLPLVAPLQPSEYLEGNSHIRTRSTLPNCKPKALSLVFRTCSSSPMS